MARPCDSIKGNKLLFLKCVFTGVAFRWLRIIDNSHSGKRASPTNPSRPDCMMSRTPSSMIATSSSCLVSK